VAKHSQLLNEIVTEVLKLARQHQTPRVTKNVTSVTFTEYWFRNSGLYDFNRDGVNEYAKPDEDEPKHAQLRVMEWFVDEENCDASNNAVQRKVEDVAAVCEQLDTLESELNAGVSDDARQELREEIISGTYTDSTLDSAIENANHDAKDRAEFGTGAVEGLATLEDNSVDCVVTDPPYGNSSGKRETVLDPFAGSGATLLAAATEDRHYVGFEESEEYADRFTRELREVTGDE